MLSSPSSAVDDLSRVSSIGTYGATAKCEVTLLVSGTGHWLSEISGASWSNLHLLEFCAFSVLGSSSRDRFEPDKFVSNSTCKRSADKGN